MLLLINSFLLPFRLAGMAIVSAKSPMPPRFLQSRRISANPPDPPIFQPPEY